MNLVLSSVPLYFVPIFVALAALVSLAWFGRKTVQSERGPAHVVSFGIACAIAVLLVDALPLFRGQHGFSHALRLARIGSADANLSFWLDAKSFVLTLGALLIAMLLLLSRSSKRATAASQSGIGIAVASLSVATLGDGFPSLLLGWTGFGVASAVVLGSTSSKAAARALGAIVGASAFIALGAGILFWGVSGRFLDGRRYLSDYRAPFAASSKVATEAALPNHSGNHASSAGEKSMLTIVTHPGARIYLGLANESQLTAKNPPFGISPMVRAELPAGLQKVAIDSGGGAIVGGDSREVALIEQVRFPPNEEVEIRAIGPTLTFHEIDAQLESDPTGFAGRQLGVWSLLDAACAALGLGALGLAFAFGRARSEAYDPRHIAFASGGTAILGAVVSLRTQAIFAAAPTFGAAVASVALIVALHAALRSARAFSAAGFLADAGRAAIALVVSASALSIAAAAMVIAIGGAAGLIVMGILFERVTTKTGERAIETGTQIGRSTNGGRGLALAAVGLLGAPIPFAGSFMGIGAIGMAAFSRGGLVGIVVATLGALTWASLAYATYRAFFCITHAVVTQLPDALLRSDESSATKASPKKTKPKGTKVTPSETTSSSDDKPLAVDMWPMVLAGVGCLGPPAAGVVLGVLGEPPGQGLVARVLIVVALAIPALVTGHLARKRYGEDRKPDWIELDRSGVLARFNEPALPLSMTSETESKAAAIDRPAQGKLGKIFLGVDRLLDAPIDLVARALARSRSEKGTS